MTNTDKFAVEVSLNLKNSDMISCILFLLESIWFLLLFSRNAWWVKVQNIPTKYAQDWLEGKVLQVCWCINHRRVSPVLRYRRNMVIYHFPLIGVIFMVILLIFIIQNYPNFFSKYYPKFTIWVIYPFIFNLGEF